MKKASKALGIIGGAASIITAVVSLIILINTVSYDSLVERILFQNTMATFMPLMYILTAISIVGGIFGIVGGILVGRNNVLAGIFMAVSAAASFTNKGVSLAASIMLILGAVFAFLRDKSAPQTSPSTDDGAAL